MLLIGDMHMTSSKWERVLEEIRLFVSRYPQEQEVIFMGDYVYHFSYDRKALLKLFNFFVELCTQGKSVHVLAGNHDWIADHFVFEEAQKTLQLITSLGEMKGRLLFYTEPQFQHIDGQECLIFPFFHPSFQQRNPIEIQKFAELAVSTHHQEQYAAYANEYLQHTIDQRKREHPEGKLVVFHHRYIANTTFPGVRWTFAYKSPALSPHRLDDERIRLISGHIHTPFVLKNYLCVGSSRHTSPLESNEQKRWCVYTAQEDLLEITPITAFPYIVYTVPPSGEKASLGQQQIQEYMEAITKQKRNDLEGWVYTIRLQEALEAIRRPEVTVTLQWEKLTYQDLHSLVDEELFTKLGDIKVKQLAKNDVQLQELLQVGGEELQRRLSSWKELLQSYIAQKYGTQAEAYMDLLHQLKII